MFPCFGGSPMSRLTPASLDMDRQPIDSAAKELEIQLLPVEIHARILKLLDPLDVLAFARTCRRFHKYCDSQVLWKHMWLKLSRNTPFTFLPAATLVDLGTNFKDACRRLWRLMVVEGEVGGLIPAKCCHCREYTCGDACVEDRQPCKVALDIGGKSTWLLTTNFALKRHLSMIAVPKVLKCFDCDATIVRDAYACDCSSVAPDLSVVYCHSRVVSSHTALEYCSQPLSNLDPGPAGRPFCLFCDEDRMNRFLCEREMVSSTKHKMKSSGGGGGGGGASSSRPTCYYTSEEEFLNFSAVVSPLTNGYCKDTASILGANNLDLLSPLLAMEHEEAFPVTRAFLSHLLQLHKLTDDLQKPNSTLIMTEPGRLPLGFKEALLKFFFEEIKIARLCLLPKALAVSQLFEVDTCLVVDSGATSTSVWVVVDGKVDESRTQTMNVGGWHVSQFLKQALTWRDNKDAAGATVSSLDTSAVKSKCRLSLNLAKEGDGRFCAASTVAAASSGAGEKNSFAKGETLHIRSQRGSRRRLEVTEIHLSSELYLAPEMMYASLDLPSMVKEATRELPPHLVKDCFSHILITGGNTDLQGFCQRFSSDLRELMPEHSPIINVCPSPTGNLSWNTVMGAYAVKVPSPYENVLQLIEPGSPLWMTREEYIVFGVQKIATFDSCIREG